MRTGAPPEVEFFWWQGCPSWRRALGILRDEMESAGLDPASVEVREVSDEDDARRVGFPGSPTIRVDGVDVDSAGDEQPVGLTCRVYRRGDGSVSPLPDPERIRAALRAGRSEGE